MKNIKTQKGITLIALVITIIVMLILVGVTISMAINGGLFGYAKKAAKDTESQKQAEQELSSGKVTVNGKEYDSINAYLESMEGVLKENTPYVSDGKTAIIPKGFKMSNKKEEQSIANGLVIQDETGNEYVWVPVEDGALDRTNWNLETGEPTGTISSELTEALPGDLVNSITINKGFYIGRYEAGRNTETTSSDTITEILTKKGEYPYFGVTYDDVTSKIQELYTDKTKYGVEATLQYGAMWDETLEFVKDEAHSVTDSKSWGNYYDQVFTFSGKYCSVENSDVENSDWVWSEELSNNNKPATYWLLTTGATERNKTKNIYDLAGNTMEWTKEKYNETECVFRGGWYRADSVRKGAARFDGGEWNSATYRGATVSNAGMGMGVNVDKTGFRVALYIK